MSHASWLSPIDLNLPNGFAKSSKKRSLLASVCSRQVGYNWSSLMQTMFKTCTGPTMTLLQNTQLANRCLATSCGTRSSGRSQQNLHTSLAAV
eukprot:UN25224